MIARSPLAKAMALVFAATVVMGAVQIALPEQPVEVEGAGQQAEARMGSRFEDMSTGTLTAVMPDEKTPDVPPSPVEEAQTMEEETPQTNPQELAAVEPIATTRIQPDPPATTSPSLATSTSAVPLTVAPSSDAVLPTPTTSALTQTPQITATVPVVTAPAQMQPVAPPSTIVAEAPDSTAPLLSMRPKRKNPELAAKVAASGPKVAQVQPRRGNAKRDNTQGAANGTSQRAKPQASGKPAKRSSQAGNAAVSNYPGQVMRRISRVSKPRVRSRGTAVISFRVSAGGGLAVLSVARSSGSAALDQAALGVIRKAVPFPRPPAGARRQFSIRIKGR